MKKFENDEVARCPFCGLDSWEGIWTDTGMPKEEYLFTDFQYEGSDKPFAYAVQCLCCRSNGPEAKTKQIALELWNKRHVNHKDR